MPCRISRNVSCFQSQSAEDNIRDFILTIVITAHFQGDPLTSEWFVLSDWYWNRSQKLASRQTVKVDFRFLEKVKSLVSIPYYWKLFHFPNSSLIALPSTTWWAIFCVIEYNKERNGTILFLPTALEAGMLERMLDVFVVCRYETGLRVQYTQEKCQCRQVIDCTASLGT